MRAMTPQAMAPSAEACDRVAAREEPHLDVVALRGRRGKPAAERQRFKGPQHRLRRLRGPGIDLGAGRVAKREADPRYIDRRRHHAHDQALDHQHWNAVMNLVCRLLLEKKKKKTTTKFTSPAST